MPRSPLRAKQLPRQSAPPQLPRNAPRKSAVRATPQIFASPSQVLNDPTEVTGLYADDHTSRKKRRVTFSRRQELTGYDREEPTVNIGPASEMPMPDTPSSGKSNLTQSSIESDSMSMSMDMSMTGVYNHPAGSAPASPKGNTTSSSTYSSYKMYSPRRPSMGRVSNLSRVISEDDEDEDSDSGSEEEEEDEDMSMDMSLTNVVQHVPSAAGTPSARKSLTRPSLAPASPSSVGSTSRMSMASPVRQRRITADQLFNDDEADKENVSRFSSASVSMEDGEDSDDSEADVEKSIAAVNDASAMSLTGVHSSFSRLRPSYSNTNNSMYDAQTRDEPSTDAVVVSREELQQTLRDTAAAESKNKNMREDWLPRLRALHAQLQAKADKERARTEAIKACDPDMLAELHQAIEEQSAILNDFRQKKQRATDQLQRVQARVDEVLVQKQGMQDAIAAAREVYHSIQGCTRGEAARLMQELRLVQSLHLWTLVPASMQSTTSIGKAIKMGTAPNSQVGSGGGGAETKRVKLIYDSALVLEAELVEGGLHAARPSIAGGRSYALNKAPALRGASVRLLAPAEGKGSAEQMGASAMGPIQRFAVDVMDDVVQGLTASACPATEVLRTISSLWLRQACLQSELDALSTRWPTSVSRTGASSSWNGLVLVADVLMRRRRAKVEVVLGCSAAMLVGPAGEAASASGAGAGAGGVRQADGVEGMCGWEAGLAGVERVYGRVDAEAMTAHLVDVLERDGGASGPSGRLAAACEDMLALFDA